MSEQDDMQTIRATVAFGLDVEAFMRSPIGRYLTQRANTDRDTAMEALKDADAEDPKAIRKLQNDVRCAGNFLIWLGEAVTEGENASRVYIASEEG